MIEDLQAFVAVVEATSLSKAATRLHITQSAVSRRLQQLESRLDGVLLDRAHRPPSLTPLGTRVYESAKVILQQVDALLSLADARSEPSGLFRLGFSLGLGDGMLERVVEQLHGDFPKVRLQVRSDWGRGLMEHLEANLLDAALVLSPTSAPVPPALDAQIVGSVDLVVVQSRRRMPFRRPVRLGALADEAWVLNPTGCGYRAAIEAAMGQQHAALHVAIDALGSELQLRLVAKGVGLGLVPRLTLASSPSAPHVLPVEVTDFRLTLDVRLLHHRETGPFKGVLAATRLYAAAALDSTGEARAPS